MSRRKQRFPLHLTGDSEKMQIPKKEMEETPSNHSITSPGESPEEKEEISHVERSSTQSPVSSVSNDSCKMKLTAESQEVCNGERDKDENSRTKAVKRKSESNDKIMKKLRQSYECNELIKEEDIENRSPAEHQFPLDLSCKETYEANLNRYYRINAIFANGSSLNGSSHGSKSSGKSVEDTDSDLDSERVYDPTNGLLLMAHSPNFQNGIYCNGEISELDVCNEAGQSSRVPIKYQMEETVVTRIIGNKVDTGEKVEFYKCHHCNVSFTSIPMLQNHMALLKRTFMCQKCNFVGDNLEKFSQHVQREHMIKKEVNISAEDTDDISSGVPVAALLSALRGNADKSNEKSEEQKSDCNSSSESHESVENVNESHKYFYCKYCSKRFDRAFSCNRHERVHTGFKPCYCTECGKGFSEPRNLRHHLIRFHSDGSMRHLIKRDRRKKQQDVPGKEGESDSNHSFTNPFNQKEEASSPKSFDQDDIYNYQNVSSYASKINTFLSSQTDVTQVDIKDEYMNNVPKLDHRNIQDNNNVLEPGEIKLRIGSKIVDDERGRRLIINNDLDETMEHSPQFSSYAPRLNIVQDRVNREKALTPITDDIGRTFYECPYCRKLFGSTSDLNRHLDFHEDLRPYDCKYCDYSARTNSQLKVHKMRHEGIKKYTCEVCNYNGVTQSDLNRHKKTQSHSARSRNICSYCHLGFYSSSQKQVHIMQCHPDMEGASSLIQMSLGLLSNEAKETESAVHVSN